jgi:hypothetical protein
MSTVSIPAFHVSDASKVAGDGQVFIQSRKDAVSSGIFSVKIAAHFDPATDDYPSGSIRIKTDLSDGAKGVFAATSVELINSYGKHNPTVYLTGRCTGDITGVESLPRGLRYWLMLADNSRNNEGTADIVGFAIHDRIGNRIAYGTGPLKGNITVAPK